MLIALLALQAAAGVASAPADWDSRPLTAGVWSWRALPIGSEATFSDSRGPQFSVRCDRTNRRVSFSRLGAAPATPIRIATTSSERSLPLGNMVLSNDPILDAIAFTRGRLWVGVAGAVPLLLRGAAEPARAIEDCRS